jgi:hypothetical protein
VKVQILLKCRNILNRRLTVERSAIGLVHRF